MSLTIRQGLVAASIGVVFAVAVACNVTDSRQQKDGATSIVPVTVRFGMLPYGDHSYAIIGAKQGHCCPRRDRPVARPAENMCVGRTPVGYLG